MKVLFLSNFSLDLNAAESGVQHKPATPRNAISTDQAPNDKGCAC
jgi:Ras-related protein Rab-14